MTTRTLRRCRNATPTITAGVVLLALVVGLTVAVAGPGEAVSRRTITLRSGSTSVVEGTAVRLTGRVTSSPVGTRIQIQRKVAGRWVRVARVPTTTRRGAFVLRVELAVAGRYTYRAQAPASATSRAVASPPRTIVVRPRQELVSAKAGNRKATGSAASRPASISANGRYVAFESEATDLVAGAGAGGRDVYLRDMVTARTVLVSHTFAGGSSPAGSFAPAISPNGRYVAFSSQASDLVAPGVDTNGNYDVFVWDRTTGSVAIASVSSAGVVGNGSSIGYPSVSDNGRVAFSSTSTNLGGVDLNGASDVFVHDLLAGTTSLVSTAGASSDSAISGSDGPAISGDGTVVVFYSAASDLDGSSTAGQSNIFRRKLGPGTAPVVVTRDVDGNAPDGASYLPSVSGDGRFVTFSSVATDLDGAGSTVPGLSSDSDVFLADTVAGTIDLLSQRPGRPAPNGGASGASISADGRSVVFVSEASNFVAADDDTRADVFLYDRVSGSVRVVSRTRTGAPPDDRSLSGSATAASASAGGRYVVFSSESTSFGVSDTNAAADVFRWAAS